MTSLWKTEYILSKLRSRRLWVSEARLEYSPRASFYGSAFTQKAVAVGIDMLETLGRRSTFASVPIERFVSQQRIFREHRGCIYSKSINSAAQPESQHVSHSGAHLRIMPVEVRLLL
jgi:hypothetical protein